MYCYRCGQRLADGAKHCPNCGASIFYNENGPLNGTAENCDECAQEGFGAGYSYHDPNKTSYSDPAGSSSYHDTYQNTDPNSSYSYYGQSSQNGYGQNAYTQHASYGSQTAYQGPPTKADGYALMALILSIASAVMCCVPYVGAPLALVGIVFAILGMKSTRRKSMAIVALIISIIFLIGNGGMLILSVYYRTHPEVMEEWMNQMESMAGMEGITFPVQ